MNTLAEQANMPVPSFYRHLKKVTSLNPLRFQKQLRIHEASRLMISDKMTANSAGLKIGYGSTTQFNREYKKLFNAPPHQDVAKIKQNSNHIKLIYL